MDADPDIVKNELLQGEFELLDGKLDFNNPAVLETIAINVSNALLHQKEIKQNLIEVLGMAGEETEDLLTAVIEQIASSFVVTIDRPLSIEAMHSVRDGHIGTKKLASAAFRYLSLPNSDSVKSKIMQGIPMITRELILKGPEAIAEFIINFGVARQEQMELEKQVETISTQIIVSQFRGRATEGAGVGEITKN